MSTNHCHKAVKWGVALAKTYNAKLFVVHIIHNPFGLEGWNLPIPSMKTLEEELSVMRLKAKTAIHQYINSEETAGLSIEEGLIEGDPKDQISKFIEKQKIDLLVTVAHEQEHIEHFISGRGIHDLVRKMPCSIFLVRRELEYEHFTK
jgi:nucleotide-binding universal stress UspA family protein